MFRYRPPKASAWGHSIGNDPSRAAAKLDVFIDKYFERVGSVTPSALILAWKESALPHVEWAAAFQGPEKHNWREILFSTMGSRVSFVAGIVFPLSIVEPSSFDFLARFSADAPFKMNAKHFHVGIVTTSGTFAWRTPDRAIAAKLEEIVG